MSKPLKKPRLTRRDLDVLRDAGTFGLIVPELIAPYRFAGKAPAAVTSTLRRLYGRPPAYLYLRPEPLDDRRVYYRLTPRGARVAEAPRSTTLRLGKQSLLRRYAMAWFICVLEPHRRELLDQQDVSQLLAGASDLPKHGFYLHQIQGAASRLGLAIVDHGAHPSRVVRKVLRTTERLIRNPATRDFIVADRMTIALLTFNELKREELARSIRKRMTRQLPALFCQFGLSPHTAHRLQLETFVVPGLLNLIPHDH